MPPEEQLAVTLVDRFSLTPPVDIHSLAARYADIQECDWPFSCDGVVLGLGSPRPKIFLKKIDNSRRMRFTLAHELGHVLLPWHVETVQCDMQQQGYPEEVTVESPNSIGIAQEHQANSFASHVLVPRAFLRDIAPGYVRVPDALARLEQANVSAAAGVVALASSLPAGYVFLVRGMSRMIRSPGTELPFNWAGITPELRPALMESSVDFGQVTHQGQLVEWFEFIESANYKPLDNEPRSSMEILIAALQGSSLCHDVDAAARSITAKVGGVLSARRDLSSVPDIQALLAYKFSMDVRYSKLLDSAEFRLYLTKKSIEVAAKRDARS
ncbi:ImmA/IrrE family metallo-endopeptidase [Streptomyces echinatus]|uniref:ImmA/IrrE family metallo-endopeptidase n=1 Tax=Streptomyces echinatus TaxID=67293 RepID=UPI0027E3262C|nr:ImmA/IrrE family metallo-endopeptidase [Streptomyces echinatus]